MIELSINNAEEAGFGEFITFKQMQVRDFTTRKEYGYVISNPPYGERIGEKEEVKQLYRDMGNAFRSLETWSVYVITSNEHFGLTLRKTCYQEAKAVQRPY